VFDRPAAYLERADRGLLVEVRLPTANISKPMALKLSNHSPEMARSILRNPQNAKASGFIDYCPDLPLRSSLSTGWIPGCNRFSAALSRYRLQRVFARGVHTRLLDYPNSKEDRGPPTSLRHHRKNMPPLLAHLLARRTLPASELLRAWRTHRAVYIQAERIPPLYSGQ
jgi:hypothetical protein